MGLWDPGMGGQGTGWAGLAGEIDTDIPDAEPVSRMFTTDTVIASGNIRKTTFDSSNLRLPLPEWCDRPEALQDYSTQTVSAPYVPREDNQRWQSCCLLPPSFASIPCSIVVYWN
jgi:hypothetical protein